MAKVLITYEAEASSLKATVAEVNKANDDVVKSAQESSKKAADAYKQTAQAAAAAFGGTKVKAALDQLNKESDKLTANLKDLQKEQILLVSSGNKLTKSYQDNIKAQAALKNQISQVNQEQAELNRTFGQTEEKQKTLTGQLRALKQELALLEEQGKDNSEEFNKLLIRAAQLEDQIGDTRERVRVLASDTFKFDAAVGATQALASSFEVAQGAAALFGSEGKELQEVIAKTTAVTAIANGVNDLANQITGQGPLKLALYAAAQKAVAVATAISTGAISAFKVALAATGITAFVGGIALLIERFKDVAKQNAEFNRVLELSKTAAENTRKAINDLKNSSLDTATQIKIANGDLSQSEADRQKAVAETQKTVETLLKTETKLQEKAKAQRLRILGEIKTAEASNEAAIRSTKESARIIDTEGLKNQLATQESIIKASESRVETIRKSAQIQIAATNQLFAAEENAKRREEAKKLADDRKKEAQDAAKAELEARNAAREKLRQLELEALASQLDERDKILNDSNTKIAELEATFAEAKFAKGSEQEKQLQDAIKIIKEQATKDIAELDQKALDDAAAKKKEAEEKLAKETLDIRIAALDAQINVVKKLEITEGTSLNRRIQLIQLDSQKRIELAKGNASEIELINAQTEEAIRAERKKSSDKAIDEAFQVAQQIVGIFSQLSQLSAQLTENRIAGINEASQAELAAINNSTKTERQKQREREALELRTSRRIAQEKIKQAKLDKSLALFNTVISTAEAVMKAGGPFTPIGALTAIAGAAQIALIAARPIPKFAKGGEVGGRLHSQGGTLIEAERGEFVTNRRQTSRHRQELDAINTSTAAFQKLINERYVRPAIQSFILSGRDKSVTVNASLNSKSMEREIKAMRKSMRKPVVINLSSSDQRYTWQ